MKSVIKGLVMLGLCSSSHLGEGMARAILRPEAGLSALPACGGTPFCTAGIQAQSQAVIQARELEHGRGQV